MSLDENENAPGYGSGGVHEYEELGTGRFENDVAVAAPPQAPSFKPEQMDAFRGTGFELIALNAWNALDAKGRKIGKAPTGRGWRSRQPLDADEAVQAMSDGRNVGVRLRACDLVVDVDPRNFPPGTDPLRQLQDDLGINFGDWPTVVTGSGGLHIYMRKPDELAVKEGIDLYPGIEFKALGRQVVAPGSIHPDTRKAYLWDDLGPRVADGVPDAPEALLRLIRRPERASTAEAGEVEAEQLAEMLSGLNAEDYRDQDRWLELMMACHHATGGAGREEFIAWSTSDAHYSDHSDVIGRRWDSLRTDRKGFTAKTLYMHLHKAGRGELIPRPTAQDDFAGGLDDPLMEGIAADIGSAPKRQGVADEWVYVIDAEVFVRRSDGKKWKKEQWKARYAGLMSQGDIISAVFRGSFPVRKFEALVYIPGGAEFPDGEQGGRYNIWKPSSVEAKAGDVSPFLEHMSYLFADEEERGYVLDYLAMLVQRPEQKINYALLVKGAQGAGKSWIGRLMTRIIGSPNVTAPSNSEVVSRWTAWTEGAQLAIIEELMCLGRLDLANRLKPIITEPTLRIEDKGCSLYSIPNHLNLIAFTNHDDAVPIERGDRRWLVVFSEAESRDEPYYERLFDYLEGDGPSAVKQWLLDREIKLSPKGMAPKTKGKAEMRRLSLSEAEQYLAELLEEGVAPFDFDLVRLDDVVNAVPVAVQRQTKSLRNRVAKWLKEEVGALKHSRYTKQSGSDRPAVQVWSIRNHEHWTNAGAAARTDAYLDHVKVIE